MNMYELQGQYLMLMEMADDEENTQAFADTLEGLTGEIEAKADSYAYVMTGIDDAIAAIDKEVERLTKRKKVLESNKDFMKKVIFDTMKIMEKSEIKTDLHKFKIQKNGGKIPVLYDMDESKPELFPEKYQAQKIVLNKDKIRADLESGIELSCAHLGERGEHLRIS